MCLSSCSSGPAHIKHGAQRSAVDVSGSNIPNQTKIRLFNYQVGDGGVFTYHPEKEAQRILAYVSSSMYLIAHFIRTRTYYESICEISTIVVKRNKPHNVTVDRRPTSTSADAIPSPHVLLDPRRDPAGDPTTLAPSTTPRCCCCCCC